MLFAVKQFLGRFCQSIHCLNHRQPITPRLRDSLHAAASSLRLQTGPGKGACSEMALHPAQSGQSPQTKAALERDACPGKLPTCNRRQRSGIQMGDAGRRQAKGCCHGDQSSPASRKGGGGGEREEPPLLTPFGLNSIRKPQRNAAWLLSLQEGPFHAQQKPTSGEQARGPCLLVSMVVRFLEAAGWKEDARFEGPRLLYYSKLNALGLREAYTRVNMPKMMALQHKPMHTVLTQKYVPLSSRDFTH